MKTTFHQVPIFRLFPCYPSKPGRLMRYMDGFEIQVGEPQMSNVAQVDGIVLIANFTKVPPIKCQHGGYLHIYILDNFAEH